MTANAQDEFVVNATTDAVDANPGDGRCAATDGTCTLRAAIQEANALPGMQTVRLKAGVYVLELPGPSEDWAASGDLDVTDDLKIVGEGPAVTIIDGGMFAQDNPGLDRVLHVIGAARVEVSGLTVKSGLPRGGLTDGGGIANPAGTLLLTNVTLTKNGAGHGGALFNGGTATITDSVIFDNSAPSGGGGIYNTGTMTVVRSRIDENRANYTAGGGVLNKGTLTISESTVNRNSSEYGGGINSVGALKLVSSTVSGNGGPFIAAGIVTGGELVMEYVTIADQGLGDGLGIFSGTVTARGTIFGGGGNGRYRNCAMGEMRAGVRGQLISLGYNIDSGNTCGLTHPTDMTNTDPLLAPLADNGGPTLSHAPLRGSPALDRVPDCPPPATDQRGVARPRPSAIGAPALCDIGAYEVETLAVTPNGSYVSGANAIVVQGGGRPSEVADLIARDSGLAVQALWLLSEGRWRYYLPAFPGIEGGLTLFSGSAMGAIAVLR